MSTDFLDDTEATYSASSAFAAAVSALSDPNLAPEDRVAEAEKLREIFANASADERSELIKSHQKELFAHVLRFALQRTDDNADFSDDGYLVPLSLAEILREAAKGGAQEVVEEAYNAAQQILDAEVALGAVDSEDEAVHGAAEARTKVLLHLIDVLPSEAEEGDVVELPEHNDVLQRLVTSDAYPAVLTEKAKQIAAFLGRAFAAEEAEAPEAGRNSAVLLEFEEPPRPHDVGEEEEEVEVEQEEVQHAEEEKFEPKEEPEEPEPEQQAGQEEPAAEEEQPAFSSSTVIVDHEEEAEEPEPAVEAEPEDEQNPEAEAEPEQQAEEEEPAAEEEQPAFSSSTVIVDHEEQAEEPEPAVEAEPEDEQNPEAEAEPEQQAEEEEPAAEEEQPAFSSSTVIVDHEEEAEEPEQQEDQEPEPAVEEPEEQHIEEQQDSPAAAESPAAEFFAHEPEPEPMQQQQPKNDLTSSWVMADLTASLLSEPAAAPAAEPQPQLEELAEQDDKAEEEEEAEQEQPAPAPAPLTVDTTPAATSQQPEEAEEEPDTAEVFAPAAPAAVEEAPAPPARAPGVQDKPKHEPAPTIETSRNEGSNRLAPSNPPATKATPAAGSGMSFTAWWVVSMIFAGAAAVVAAGIGMVWRRPGK